MPAMLPKCRRCWTWRCHSRRMPSGEIIEWINAPRRMAWSRRCCPRPSSLQPVRASTVFRVLGCRCSRCRHAHFLPFFAKTVLQEESFSTLNNFLLNQRSNSRTPVPVKYEEIKPSLAEGLRLGDSAHLALGPTCASH